jgi:cytosine/adenosine deaminase-related metal-dependent hydrolase
MSNFTIRSDFGFIGEDLELKKDISININEKGRIREIKCEAVKDSTEIAFYKNASLIIPGLINSHIHIGDSFARELGHNKQLIEVVAPPNGLKHKLLKNIDKDIKIKGIRTAISEMLSYGTTYFIDYRENDLDSVSILRNALKNSSIRAMILGRPTDDKELESIYNGADGIGYASYKDISIKSKEKLILIKKNFPGKLISCHDAELERNEETFDKIITDGLIDVIIHGTQYNEKDLTKIKQKAISLILCPRSNGYFGVGFPPISKIFRLRIPVSLGTDNVMINNLDLFEELRYLYRIYRVMERNNEELKLTSLELLKMITINAAKNFRIEKDYGSLSEGKFADFFMVNLSAPNLYCFHIDKIHFYNLIVQRLNPNNIIKVYIGGNIVYERN